MVAWANAEIMGGLVGFVLCPLVSPDADLQVVKVFVYWDEISGNDIAAPVVGDGFALHSR